MTDIPLVQRINSIIGRIARAADRAGRNPEEVKLVAVTKAVSAGSVKEAIEAGLRIFAENRVQEAQGKISNLKFEISNYKTQWHLIGHLQRNKVKYAVPLFDCIQSVDSLKLAELINEYAKKAGKVQRVLIQVKLSEEETKYGLSGEDIQGLLQEIKGMDNIKAEGLMAIPPYFDAPELVRPYFRRLREFRDELGRAGLNLPELSMGMSHDFEVAVEEGATMVRVGTAIFGQRG